jgi:Ca-activated chloride channel homolog
VNFQHPEAIIPLFIGVIVLTVLYWKQEKSFYQFIYDFWFYRQSIWSRLSSLCFLAGFILLSIVLLDPRGPEKRVKGQISKDQTIILMDTSTSMLTEDLKPNRLEKAIWMAKHLVRNIFGHEVAILIFADITKKLTPFTDDMDLLDARLDSLRAVRKLQAGSDISSAIMEAVQFFKTNTEPMGNIVVFTDGEDHEQALKLEIPEKINLIFVGVGTQRGGPIPLKDSQGLFFGNKKYRGETVTSRLSEDFFKKTAAGSKNIFYFIPRNNQMPTNDIISVMKNQKLQQQEKDNIIRPVEMQTWAVPGIILLILSYIFKNMKGFVLTSLLIISMSSFAQEEEKENKLSEEALKGLQLLQENKLSSSQKLALADKLASEKQPKVADILYQEEFTNEASKKENPASYFNYGTMKLQEKKYAEGFQVYKDLKKWLEKNELKISEDLKKEMDENIERAFAQSSSSGQGEGEGKDQSQSGDSQNQEGQGKSSKNNKSKEGEGDQKKNPFDTKNKDQEKKAGKNEEKKDESGKGEKPEEQEPQVSQGEPQDPQKGKKKLSPLLEQLKSDDRQLQGKLLDTQTQKRLKSRKDW